MLRTHRKNNRRYTNATFKALTEAVIPKLLAQKQGKLEPGIDKYHIWVLNHSLSPTILKKVFNIPLAKPTARMLDQAASQLIKNKGNKKTVNPKIVHHIGPFAALSPGDRLRAMTLLERLKVNPFSLPALFSINPGLVLSVTGTVMMLTTIGYYSGWSGYGSTSLQSPEMRTMEHFPAGWKQAGYPGPSLGYREFRGYLIDEFTE